MIILGYHMLKRFSKIKYNTSQPQKLVANMLKLKLLKNLQPKKRRLLKRKNLLRFQVRKVAEVRLFKNLYLNSNETKNFNLILNGLRMEIG